MNARLGERFEARVRELMQQVRLPTEAGFLARLPGAVSVGQAQRVVLALALLHRPALLIADEPTSALDPVTQMDILELLREVNRSTGRRCFIFRTICSRCCGLRGGWRCSRKAGWWSMWR